MMIGKKIKNIIKQKFDKPEKDKKDWLDNLVENLETQWLENANIPFKIMELKNTGFVIKISGLYGFISFFHMPWKYNNVNHWTSISHKLIGKIFFCQIHNITKAPSLSIIINGQIPQFRKTELVIGENYKGIIVEKVENGVLVEIGYHFDWKCGSFVGFLNRSQFDSVKLLANCSVGDELEVLYQGLNKKGRIIYTQTNEKFDWDNEIPQSLVGQIVLVHIVRKAEEKVKFLVNGKYNGKIYLEGNNHLFGSKQRTRKVKDKLKDGEIIHCEVIGFKEKMRFLEIRWIAELDMKIIDREYILESTRPNIANNLDNGTVQKLMKIRDEIESKEMHVS